MRAISEKEECLSALKSLYNNVSKIDDSEYEYEQDVLLKCINERYDDTLYSYYASVFEDRDLTTLFETYAFANDSNLSKDAIEMKNELNDILHRFNKERNRELVKHYQEMRERVVAQSNVINELNDQLSRYYNFDQWQMEMVEKRCNPPLKFEELKINTPYWDNEDKVWCYFTSLHEKIRTGVKITIDNPPMMGAFAFKEGRYYAREVKE